MQRPCGGAYHIKDSRFHNVYTTEARPLSRRLQPVAALCLRPLNVGQTCGIIAVEANDTTRDNTHETRFRAPVAQRIRASDYGSEGRGFESLQARQI